MGMLNTYTSQPIREGLPGTKKSKKKNVIGPGRVPLINKLKKLVDKMERQAPKKGKKKHA